jgi:hypothetical protein
LNWTASRSYETVLITRYGYISEDFSYTNYEQQLADEMRAQQKAATGSGISVSNDLHVYTPLGRKSVHCARVAMDGAGSDRIDAKKYMTRSTAQNFLWVHMPRYSWDPPIERNILVGYDAEIWLGHLSTFYKRRFGGPRLANATWGDVYDPFMVDVWNIYT